MICFSGQECVTSAELCRVALYQFCWFSAMLRILFTSGNNSMFVQLELVFSCSISPVEAAELNSTLPHPLGFLAAQKDCSTAWQPALCVPSEAHQLWWHFRAVPAGSIGSQEKSPCLISVSVGNYPLSFAHGTPSIHLTKPPLQSLPAVLEVSAAGGVGMLLTAALERENLAKSSWC